MTTERLPKPGLSLKELEGIPEEEGAVGDPVPEQWLVEYKEDDILRRKPVCEWIVYRKGASTFKVRRAIPVFTDRAVACLREADPSEVCAWHMPLATIPVTMEGEATLLVDTRGSRKPLPATRWRIYRTPEGRLFKVCA